MHLTQVNLRSFRNYHRLEIPLSQGLTLLVGDNAQGKTNFLEAVYLCCMGKSHRTAKDKEMVAHEALAAIAKISVSTRFGGQTTQVQIPARGQKRFLFEGVPLKGVADLIGRTRCVFFSPEDLRLVKDGPAERRRFMDRELSQIHPGYLKALMQYTHALKQRNALLRQGDGLQIRSWMQDFDKVLADRGLHVLSFRSDFVRTLQEIIPDLHQDLSDKNESLEVSYEGGSVKDVDEYLWHLNRTRDSDLRRGLTTFGPHRDDLKLMVNHRDVRAFGSQGQQRTVALALKLSEIQIMASHTGEPPILLLDDVLSELDEKRQRKLLAKAATVQTLVTAAVHPPTITHATILRVKEGCISPL